jgi:hypothetical protein
LTTPAHGKAFDMDDERRRCEHLACLCNVTGSAATCSEACASVDRRDPHDIICACGHAECARTIDEQLHGQVGRESPV